MIFFSLSIPGCCMEPSSLGTWPGNPQQFLLATIDPPRTPTTLRAWSPRKHPETPDVPQADVFRQLHHGVQMGEGGRGKCCYFFSPWFNLISPQWGGSSASSSSACKSVFLGVRQKRAWFPSDSAKRCVKILAISSF